jgi:5'-3' exonuclease
MPCFCLPAALPTLDIAEGALNNLIDIYKRLLPRLGGYLTYAGQLNHARLEMLLKELGGLELETLSDRAAVSQGYPCSSFIEGSPLGLGR